MGDVEPIFREMATARAFTLGDLVFVVREDEIDSAGVKVEGIAEVFLNHRRAFEVPPGATFAPG